MTERVESRAWACDLVAPVLEWLDIRGEFFDGQALRGLGGGGIGQNFTPLNEPLESTGGWAQVNVRIVESLRAGVGCGGDHPQTAALRHRNDVCSAYVLVKPAGPIFLGLEYRRMATTYSVGRFTNDHVTLGTGFEF